MISVQVKKIKNSKNTIDIQKKVVYYSNYKT